MQLSYKAKQITTKKGKENARFTHYKHKHRYK